MSVKIKYVSVRCYIQTDGESWRAIASVERDVDDKASPESKALFGEVKRDPLEAIADALERAGVGS